MSADVLGYPGSRSQRGEPTSSPSVDTPPESPAARGRHPPQHICGAMQGSPRTSSRHLPEPELDHTPSRSRSGRSRSLRRSRSAPSGRGAGSCVTASDPLDRVGNRPMGAILHHNTADSPTLAGRNSCTPRNELRGRRATLPVFRPLRARGNPAAGIPAVDTTPDGLRLHNSELARIDSLKSRGRHDHASTTGAERPHHRRTRCWLAPALRGAPATPRNPSVGPNRCAGRAARATASDGRSPRFPP
jgi:hypothetical protein